MKNDDMQNKALRKLRYLEVSKTLNDLRHPPGNRLEPTFRSHGIIIR